MVSPDPLSPLRCPRCERSLEFVGTTTFSEGALEEHGKQLVDNNWLDIYLCPECGRVEYFAQSMGEEFRQGT